MKSSLKIDEREYCSALDSLRFSEEAKAGMTRKLMSAGERPAKTARSFRRVLVAVTACILVLALSVTALAAGIPDFRTWLFGPDSGVADTLTPVSAFGNNDGLTLEVLGATGDKNNVCVYFTLQDTAGENRLREDMDVVASVKLNDEYPEREDVIEGGMERSTEVVKYDPETQTALCRFQMTTGKLWDNSAIDFASEPYDATGAQVRLRVTRVIVTNDKFGCSPLDISNFESTSETLPVSNVQYGEITSVKQFENVIEDYKEVPLDEAAGVGITLKNFKDETGKTVVLKPGNGIPVEGREYAQITAVGFVGGKLHIQSRSFDAAANVFANNPVYTNQAMSVYCVDAGAPVPPIGGENANYKILEIQEFHIAENGEAMIGMAINDEDLASNDYYQETVFDIGPDEMENFDFYVVGNDLVFRIVNFTAENFTLEENTPERVQELLK